MDFDPEHKFAVPPYDRSTDKVCIVGMAATSRHMAAWDDPSWEIWGLNEAYHPKNQAPDKTPYMKRWTRWFQMHPRWDYTRLYNFNDPEHPQWLRNEGSRRKTDFPIYTLEYDPEIPGSIRFPLTEIIQEYESLAGNGEEVKYFTNSFGLMMALAVHLGFKEIALRGFEMASETEYGQQKANAEFWIGVCIGRGLHVDIPRGCALLGETVPMYGYEKIPGITEMHLEIYINGAKKRANELQAELNKCLGEKEQLGRQFLAMQGKSKTKMESMQKEMGSIIEKEINLRIQLQNSLGMASAFETVIRDMKSLPKPPDAPLVLPKDKIQIIGFQVAK